MEKYYLAALAHCLGYAATEKLAKLIKIYGSAEAAYKAGKHVLAFLKAAPGLEAFYQNRYDTALPQALGHYCQDHHVALITRTDASYPQLLNELFDPPAVLYVQGQPLSQENCFAIVGSRKATSYGIAAAEHFAGQLALHGITIVSGGAYGIDAAAHEGALQVDGKTIVVLGGGLDNLYPARHKSLFHRVREHGSIITEYAPWEEPKKAYFPLRNRIIVGLCQGVLIVEAAQQSGAMITAHVALNENRDVYAIPGSIFSDTSKGTNSLIKEGAHLAATPADILEDYNLEAKAEKKTRTISLFSEDRTVLTLGQKQAYNYIRECPGIKLEEIVVKLGLTLSAVSCILLELQLGGHIVQEQNNRYRAI